MTREWLIAMAIWGAAFVLAVAGSGPVVRELLRRAGTLANFTWALLVALVARLLVQWPWS